MEQHYQFYLTDIYITPQFFKWWQKQFFQLHMEHLTDHIHGYKNVSINFKGFKSYKVCSLTTIELN